MEELNTCIPKPIWGCYDDTGELIEKKPKISELYNSHYHIHDFSIHICNVKQLTTSTSSNSDGTFMASTCCGDKIWSKKDVLDVLTLESAYFQTSTFTLKLPDKKVTNKIVKQFDSAIHGVLFLQSQNPRSCCVAVQESSKCKEIVKSLNNQEFGFGFLTTSDTIQAALPSLNDVDPFTLFLDDIPLDMPKQQLIDMFLNCVQITIGYTNKIYYIKRYAFAIYDTVEDALDSFKVANDKSNYIVRFRLFSGTARMPEQNEIQKCQNMYDRSVPIVTDPGPPVLSTERAFNDVKKVTIDCELPYPGTLNDRDSDIETVNSTDFNVFYENFRQSRAQLNVLKPLE